MKKLHVFFVIDGLKFLFFLNIKHFFQSKPSEYIFFTNFSPILDVFLRILFYFNYFKSIFRYNEIIFNSFYKEKPYKNTCLLK